MTPSPKLALAVFMALSIAQMALAQSVAWTQRAVSGPSPRLSHAMAYDSAHGVTVLFGGHLLGNAVSGETWVWNGTAWTQRQVSGPSPRSGHAMAYDAVRGVTVLFGGQDAAGDKNRETWEWNGSTWTLRANNGPIARINHAMAYDSNRGVTVLFGGSTGIGSGGDETWEWNGTTWTQRTISGPSPRYYHAMDYDSARHVAVFFGGLNNNVLYNGDTWEWGGSGATWTSRPISGPAPRLAHAMAYDANRGVSVLFGGSTASSIDTDETWEWNGATWFHRLISGPSARNQHAMVYDSTRSCVVLFGGYPGGSPNGETWELGGAQCDSANCSCPPHSAQCDEDAYGQVSGLLMRLPWPGSALHQPFRVSQAYCSTEAGDDHHGYQVDFEMQVGTPIVAIADGTIIQVGGTNGVTTQCNGCTGIAQNGIFVRIKHRSSDGVTYYNSVYLHLSYRVPALTCGMPVSRGQTIGYSGNTGHTLPIGAGYHLHLEIKQTTDSTFDCGTPTVDLTPVRPVPILGHRDMTSDTSICDFIRYQLYWAPPGGGCTSDFNGDGDERTDADIEAFFACIAGNCCATCGSADFNGDGDTATDADIESFFRVLAGGTC